MINYYTPLQSNDAHRDNYREWNCLLLHLECPCRAGLTLLISDFDGLSTATNVLGHDFSILLDVDHHWSHFHKCSNLEFLPRKHFHVF